MELRARAVLLVLALVQGAACAPPEPFQARFAVRGRWPGERELSWRVEEQGGPLSSPALERAARAAMAAWERTGCARFRPARPDEEPALVLAWKRGAHGDCPPFGTDPSVAHAGPVGPGTFVHFDAGRAWSAATLEQAALHELGHVLGLDHSPDEDALMYHEPSPARARIARTDLAGIHALYGGGAPERGDLVVVAAEGAADGDGEGHGERALVLPAVAPPERVAWAPFDTDGDGSAELVTWRTDAAGHGELWSFHFGPGPELVRTLGPLYGLSGPGFALELVRDDEGARYVVLRPEHGAPRVRSLDAQGLPQVFEGELPKGLGVGNCGAGPVRADLDGDGRAETIRRRE